jgi:adenylate cyclase
LRRARRPLIGALLGLVAGFLSLLLAHASVARGLEDLTYDWRLQATARPADARRDIALVLIDESSLRALEPTFGAWPWPRMLHAGAIDFLARAGAKVIGYDVLFLEHDRRLLFEISGDQMSGTDSDSALVAAVRRAGNVVLLADAVHEGLESGEQANASDALRGSATSVPSSQLPGFPERAALRPPFAELAAAAVALGHNYVIKGTGGAARAVTPFAESRGTAIPSLGMAAALIAKGTKPAELELEAGTLVLGRERMPLLPTREALLNFHGPFSTNGTPTYPIYSFFNLLLSEDQLSRGETPAIDPAAFKDKIVFVGTSADGLADIWKTPFSGPGMPGVQLHAALADDVLSGRFMGRADLRDDAWLALGLGVASGVLATALPVIVGVPLVLAVAAAVGAWLMHLTATGVWIAAVPAFTALALATFQGVAWQYFVEGRAKRQVTRLFGRYVSKDVFSHLMADPSVARLGGERREMTVLFSDIRGFTAASERAAPEAVVQQLNEYFSAMVEVLFRHQGTLDKFVGDMVMGLFGAPVRDARHADHAVAAALEMTGALDRLNAGWRAEGRPTLEIGIGINSGEMIAGNIGSDTIMSYTVIGDAVNLGARLESLTKEYGARILISDETRLRLTSSVVTRLIGEVTVKGRTRPVTVHEVLKPS